MASGLAKLAIATELFLSVGLWLWRTRVFALWWGVCFHLTIEATSRVEGFTWLTLAMYALFATPDARARTLAYDPARLAHAASSRAPSHRSTGSRGFDSHRQRPERPRRRRVA